MKKQTLVIVYQTSVMKQNFKHFLKCEETVVMVISQSVPTLLHTDNKFTA